MKGKRSSFYISVQKLCDTYNSTLYVINYYCPFGLPPLINKMVGEPFLLYHWRFFAQR